MSVEPVSPASPGVQPTAATERIQSPASQRLASWYRIATTVHPELGASLEDVERTRRSRFMSLMLPTLLGLDIAAAFVLLATGMMTTYTLIQLGIAAASIVMGFVLNRGGAIESAGLLVVAAVDFVIAMAAWQNGAAKLEMTWLFVIPVLLGATFFRPLSVLPLGLTQIVLTIGIVFLQWNDPYVQASVGHGQLRDVGLGIFLQLFAAFVSGFWSWSSLKALRRADRAEEVAQLLRRESAQARLATERKQELEQGIGQIQTVLVQVSNGNFHARVPALKHPLLWPVGSGLNEFLQRMAQVAQVEFQMQRAHEEAARVAEALFMLRTGRQPIWPAPSGTPLDVVIEAATGNAMPRALQQRNSRPLGSGPLNPPSEPGYQSTGSRPRTANQQVWATRNGVRSVRPQPSGPLSVQTGPLAAGDDPSASSTAHASIPTQSPSQ